MNRITERAFLPAEEGPFSAAVKSVNIWLKMKIR